MSSRAERERPPGLRIVVLVSALDSGGAERVAVTLANAWTARGDSVRLVATYADATTSFYTVAPGVDLRFMAIPSEMRLRRTRLWRLLALRSLIREFEPDAVVSLLTNVNVAAIAATAALGVPTIVCERTDPRKMPISSSLAAQRWASYRFADMVTVQTRALRMALGERWLGSRRIREVANPIPPDLLAGHGASQASSRIRQPVVAAVGRLSKEKRFDQLIRCFGEVARPGWELRIFGEGPERASLQGLIKSMPQHAPVRLMGAVKDLWAQLATSGMFVLCSSFEGFPNALLEAMAVGLPCVSFDCPSGPAEMTDTGRDALLVPADDWAALAAAMGRLMSDGLLRADVGARAAASVRRRYAVEPILARWDELFAEVGVARATTARPAACDLTGD